MYRCSQPRLEKNMSSCSIYTLTVYKHIHEQICMYTYIFIHIKIDARSRDLTQKCSDILYTHLLYTYVFIWKCVYVYACIFIHTKIHARSHALTQRCSDGLKTHWLYTHIFIFKYIYVHAYLSTQIRADLVRFCVMECKKHVQIYMYI